MTENNGWLKAYMEDHSHRLASIEDKLSALTGKVYGNAAMISLSVALATALIVGLLLR